MSIKVQKFYAEWCGPCKQFGPVLNEVLEDYDFEYEEVNIDENTDKAADLLVLGVPTTIIYKDGVEVERMTGYKAKEVLKTEFDKLLK